MAHFDGVTTDDSRKASSRRLARVAVHVGLIAAAAVLAGVVGVLCRPLLQALSETFAAGSLYRDLLANTAKVVGGWSLLGGAGIGWATTKPVAVWIVDTVLAPFPEDLLDRIKAPPAQFSDGHDTNEEPTARKIYIEPGSAFETTLAAARAFVLKGAAGGVRLTGKEAEIPFAWTILNGEPGGGKTRLSVELARSLARRDLLGGPSDQQRWDKRRVRLRAWLRETAPFLGRQPETDPWDAGRIGKADLSGFLPRRPTLLLLDDGDPTATRAIVNALNAASVRWRKPVRLIIIDQVRPATLGIDPRSEAAASAPNFAGALPSLQHGTVADIRAFVTRALGSGVVWPGLNLDADYQRLGQATQGNPLLLLIALGHLRRGEPLSSLNPKTILAGRARMALSKLKAQAHDNPVRLDDLFISTLASGPAWKAWEEVVGAGRTLEQTRAGWTLERALDTFPYAPEAPAWRRRVETGSGATMAPMVRPDLIADQVLRLALAEQGEGADDRIAAAWMSGAWRASPGGTMRTVLRTTARPMEEDDILGAALSAPPPVDIFGKPAEAAALVIQAAVTGPWGPGFAQPVIDALEGGEVVAQAEEFALALEAAKDIDAAAVIATRLLERAGPALNHRNQVARLTRFLVAVVKAGGTPSHEPMLEFARQVDAIVGPAFAEDRDLQVDRAFAWSAAAMATRSIDNNEDCLAAADRYADTVDVIASRFPPHDLSFQMMRVQAWTAAADAASYFPEGARLDIAERRAAKVDEIAEPFGSDWSIRTKRLEAWNAAARAAGLVMYGGGLDAAKAHLATIDSIVAASGSGDPILEAQRVKGRNSVLTALTQTANVDEAERLAKEVDQIAAEFTPTDFRFQPARAFAWRQVAMTASKSTVVAVLASARTYAEAVDRIAAGPFSSHRDVQFNRLVAWRYAVQAATQSGDLQGAERWVGVVDSIAAALPRTDQAFQRELVFARTSVLTAAGRDGGRADLTLVERYAREIETISKAYPAELGGEAFKAWGLAAVAAFKSPKDAALKAVESCIAAMDRLAADIRDASPRERLAQAVSWREIAGETKDDSRREVPALARICIERVSDIVHAFPDTDVEAQKELHLVLNNFVSAACALETGPLLEEAEQTVERLESIAARFQDDPWFHNVLASGWAALAQGASRLPEGRGLAKAKQCAARIDEIASRFPDDDRNIQIQRAFVQGDLATAAVRLPDGAGWEVAAGAAKTVTAIAKRIPDDQPIGRLQVWVLEQADKAERAYKASSGPVRPPKPS